MAQPPAYNRAKDFTEDFGSETDHSALNSELDSAANSINDIRANLAILQADDGNLRPSVVTADSISDDLRTDLVNRAASGAADAATTATAKAAEAATSATAAAGSAFAADSSATEASDWAQKTGAYVTGALASAKEWAIGVLLRGVAGGGSAKDWATYTGGTVDDAEYSAKKHAADAASSAVAAAGSVAAASLPGSLTGKALQMLRVLADASGYELRTPGQVRTDISAAASGANGDITSLSAITSVNGGPLAGLRNRLINGNFAINQTNVSGTVTLAAGAYGHDGWKAGAAGCTYTFAASGSDTIITISAGSLMQVIEDKNIEGGTYAVSHAGTAQARIAINGAATSGSYAAASQSTPLVSASATGGQSVTVEFSTGTVSKAMMELGTVATAFERIHYGLRLAICQRYYETGSCRTRAAGISPLILPVSFKQTKRATPTVVVTGGIATATDIYTNGFSFSWNTGSTFDEVDAWTASARL